jgi:hypothetical protein
MKKSALNSMNICQLCSLTKYKDYGVWNHNFFLFFHKGMKLGLGVIENRVVRRYLGL